MRRSANTTSSKVFGVGGLWPLGGFNGFGHLLKVASHTLSESLCCIRRCSPPWIGYRLMPAGLSKSTAQPMIFQPYLAAMASFLACCGNESLMLFSCFISWQICLAQWDNVYRVSPELAGSVGQIVSHY